MRWLVIPTTGTVTLLAGMAVAACLALLAGLPVGTAAVLAGAALLPALAWALFDLWRSRRLWRLAPLRIERTLPGAFSLGVPTGRPASRAREAATAAPASAWTVPAVGITSQRMRAGL